MVSFALLNFTVSPFKQISSISIAQMSWNSIDCETLSMFCGNKVEDSEKSMLF